MNTSRLMQGLITLLIGFLLFSFRNASNQVHSDEVPPNVRNSFNRIFIDHDPETWHMELVKPKGGKKEKRYIAEFNDPEGSYRVRFEENGRAVGYVMSFTERNEVPESINAYVLGLYPTYSFVSYDLVHLYNEGSTYYRVNLKNKSRQEQVFVTLEGALVTAESSISEFYE